MKNKSVLTPVLAILMLASLILSSCTELQVTTRQHQQPSHRPI